MQEFLVFVFLALFVLGKTPGSESIGTGSPSPLQFDFDVKSHLQDITAQELWLQHESRKRKRGEVSLPFKYFKDIFFVMSVFLGSSKQKNDLLIDTGSSDLWVPASGYDPRFSTTSLKTEIPFDIEYIDGLLITGEYYLDSLQFNRRVPALEMFRFALSESKGPGVLGIGNRETEATSMLYDNLPWALYKDGITPKASYSMHMSPGAKEGKIIFGGIDTAKYDGELYKYPLIYLEGELAINLQSVIVGEKTISMNVPYIIDTGCSIGLAGEELMSELDVIFETSIRERDGMFYRLINCSQPSDKFVRFNFGDNEITMSHADLLSFDEDGQCVLGFASFEDFRVLGNNFMRYAYVNIDLSELTLSLAQMVHSPESHIVSA